MQWSSNDNSNLRLLVHGHVSTTTSTQGHPGGLRDPFRMQMLLRSSKGHTPPPEQPDARTGAGRTKPGVRTAHSAHGATRESGHEGADGGRAVHLSRL